MSEQGSEQPPSWEGESGFRQDMIDAIKDAAQDGVVDIDFAYGLRDPETGAMITDGDGRAIVGDRHFVGRLLDIGTDTFMIELRGYEVYSQMTADKYVTADTYDEQFVAIRPEIVEVPFDAVCDLNIVIAFN